MPNLSEPKRYILFYKPYNVLTQFSDRTPSSLENPTTESGSTRLTLKDFIAVANVYPAGRLDQDSEGLLLLTNDGRLQHRLTDPQFGHPRTYWVQVERIPNEAALQTLRQGVTIKGYRTRPANVQTINEPDLPPRDPPIRYRKSVPTAWLEMTLTEGRNRQVRRMTAAIGHPTLRLIRVAIAHLTLAGLHPGEWRDVTPAEIRELQRVMNPQTSKPRSPSNAPRRRTNSPRHKSRS